LICSHGIGFSWSTTIQRAHQENHKKTKKSTLDGINYHDFIVNFSEGYLNKNKKFMYKTSWSVA